MASDLVPAIWQGPYPAQLPDMSVIYPGEQHLVTSEDLKSAHWKAADESPTSAPSAMTPSPAIASTPGATSAAGPPAQSSASTAEDEEGDS